MYGNIDFVIIHDIIIYKTYGNYFEAEPWKLLKVY
jgi:hypothetical protein